MVPKSIYNKFCVPTTIGLILEYENCGKLDIEKIRKDFDVDRILLEYWEKNPNMETETTMYKIIQIERELNGNKIKSAPDLICHNADLDPLAYKNEADGSLLTPNLLMPVNTPLKDGSLQYHTRRPEESIGLPFQI